ncbi:hypothetical protein PM082_022267 [Marasmius tenuissimus]|nr:hypothetical protein PM082_022267 [Marasmius tenuissimus]
MTRVRAIKVARSTSPRIAKTVARRIALFAKVVFINKAHCWDDTHLGAKIYSSILERFPPPKFMSNDALESHTGAIRRIVEAEVSRRRQRLPRTQRRQRIVQKELVIDAHSTHGGRQPGVEEITENDPLGSDTDNGLAVVPYSQDAFQPEVLFAGDTMLGLLTNSLT